MLRFVIVSVPPVEIVLHRRTVSVLFEIGCSIFSGCSIAIKIILVLEVEPFVQDDVIHGTCAGDLNGVLHHK